MHAHVSVINIIALKLANAVIFVSSSLLKHCDYHHRQEKSQRCFSDDEDVIHLSMIVPHLIMFLVYYIIYYRTIEKCYLFLTAAEEDFTC